MPVIPPIPQGLSATELKYQRVATRAFIEANPMLVELTPRVPVKTKTGTTYDEQPARPAQMMRLVDQTRTFGAEPGKQQAADGVQRRMQYQLLGLHDSAIGLHDVWTDADGIRWEVIDLLPPNGYEQRATVIRYGQG